MRISDWSSDVCSSDLDENELVKQAALQAGKLADQKQAAEDLARERKRAAEDAQRDREAEVKAAVQREERDRESIRQAQIKAALLEHELATGERLSGAEEELFELQTRAHLVTGQNLEAEPGKRSEERRGGKECVSTCGYRWSPTH